MLNLTRRDRPRLWLHVSSAGLFVCLASGELCAQGPAESADQRQAANQQPLNLPRGDQQPAALTFEQSVQLPQWIAELGSREFAARERAAEKLAGLGPAVIPELRRAAKESEDPEIRLRAKEIVQQLTRGDLQARIDDFLSGKEEIFPGWQYTRAILGDSATIRELFVEMMTNTANVTELLEGTRRDRTVAMENAMTHVRNKIYVDLQHPTVADAFALMLPVFDTTVPINANYDGTVLDVLRKKAASQIQDNARLSRAYKVLLSRWLIRSSLADRDEVLTYGMEWDLPATRQLARQTLGETEQTETLAIALQALIRFGRPDDTELILPLLDDTRPAVERGFAQGNLRSQLGDVAMATLAVLNGIPLSDIGLKDVKMDAKRGVRLSEIGYPVDDDGPRKAARAKIDRMLESQGLAEGS